MPHRDHDRTTASAETSPARRPLVPRLLRPALVLPAAVLAVAGTCVTALTTYGHHHPVPAHPASAAPHVVVALERLARVAGVSDTHGRGAGVPVGEDQFVYTRSVIRSNTGAFGGRPRLNARRTRETWETQGTRPVLRTGTLRESGKGAALPGLLPVVGGVPIGPGVFHPTYRWLGSLPTEPGALLMALGKQMPGSFQDEPKEQALFDAIGAVVGQWMPPSRTAAFHRAMAGIPGVRVVPDVVDAAGRHGVGVTRTEPGDPTRTEYVFDPRTGAYLGSNAYFATYDGPDILFGSEAIVQHAVVDHDGESPRTHPSDTVQARRSAGRTAAAAPFPAGQYT